ncbi:MAG: 30S ribosomal protein S8 [Planctomycetaceae bacterium]|jgi:small subunit ribosomal protein S8|nr:30S ribosomal protein S8 [Planctomycetaceae bacterium]
MLTDPIADLLTRIRNAVRIEKVFVDVPVSNEKKGIVDVLKREGYIWDWEVVESKPVSLIRVHLKYGPNAEKVIGKVKRVSKPGRRIYVQASGLKPVLNGLGIQILNTNRGILSDREAKLKNVGGEVIGQIW